MPRLIAKPWFLYMIECQDNSIYTGVAVDVVARYTLHVNGNGARYTRSHPPRRLIAVIEYPDRSSALKAEHRIKKLSSANKRFFAQTYALYQTNLTTSWARKTQIFSSEKYKC